MTLPDIINGSFEAFGAVAIAFSCARLLKDKQVKGLSLVTTAFFTSWGLFNLYYYPKLGQSFSGMAAAGVCLANSIWCYLIIKYRGNKVPNKAANKPPGLTTIRAIPIGGDIFLSAADVFSWARACQENKRSGVFMRKALRDSCRGKL